MRDKRVLITGGAGFVGSHIADLVATHQPQEIVIFDNFSRGRMENLTSALSSGNVSVIRGDIRDTSQVAEVMAGISIVFHQAAIDQALCAEEPRLALDVLAKGTFNVLEAAAKAGVDKIIAASSASVPDLSACLIHGDSYGNNKGTLYRAAISFNQALTRSFAEMHGFDFVVLHYSNVYGPRMGSFSDATRGLMRWMERLEHGDAPTISGDAMQTVDFIDVRDVARANIAAAMSEVSGEVLDVASGTQTSLTQLQCTLAAALGTKIVAGCAPQPNASPLPSLADTINTRDMIGFSADISLSQGLGDLVSWWRQEQAQKGLLSWTQRA